MDLKKIEHGQFYTINNPFDHKMFKQWLSLIPNIETQVFLEPFAGINLQFNHKAGQIGLLAIDGTKAPSIRFTPAEAVRDDEVKHTSRGKTRILIDTPDIEINRDELIAKCNTLLAKHREETSDIFLTPFRGLRKDGRYRRRLDFKMARNIINQAVKELH